MSKADTTRPSGKDDAPRSGSEAGAEHGNEFAIHEHIGRHLKVMFDEVANEPIPDRLRQLLDSLERKEMEAEQSPTNPVKTKTPAPEPSE